MKVVLNIIPINQCNSDKSYLEQNNLRYGIDDASMMCAGYLEGGKDTCGVRILYAIYVKHVDDLVLGRF